MNVFSINWQWLPVNFLGEDMDRKENTSNLVGGSVFMKQPHQREFIIPSCKPCSICWPFVHSCKSHSRTSTVY